MSFESEHPVLTAEQLQEHIQSPTQSDGIPTIELRRYTIDLRSENEEFRTVFYRLLQEQLQQRSSPLGLDLSNSVIRGNLAISSLGLRVPLYGQNLPTILSDDEQEQLQRDRRRLFQLSQLSRSLLIQDQSSPVQIAVFRGPLKLLQTRFEGRVDFTNTFFLGRIDAQGAEFLQDIDGAEARFSQIVRFTGTTFQKDVRWRNSIFFKQIDVNQAQFQGTVTFQSSVFQATANFSQVFFAEFANFSRIEWLGNADFAQSQWQGQAFFNKSKFAQSLFLTKATFENRVLFREAQFNEPVNLRGASILGQADFGDATFASDAYLNVSGLEFNAEQAKILGNPGQIGRVLSVPSLQGNETLLRNLVRNFRILEQIPDANQMEYTTERLRLRKLRQRLLGTNLNTASLRKLEQIGLTHKQALAIIKNRDQQPFQDVTDLLKLEEIDLATYVKVRDRTIADSSNSLTDRIFDATRWLALSLLILLTRYGTSFWLIFGIGILLTAYFGILFWVVDRLRRFHPYPVLPNTEESVWMSASFSILTLTGLSAIFNTAENPWLTLACLSLIGVPVPGILLILLYKQGRYHDLMTSSYFVQDGGARELRILIGRLPVIPQFAFFRDRFKPIPWDRRWNWLNYFDFSLINLVRLGFNDIRLRDEYMPGLITSLVWYQWALGLLYIALLLWTLSRTIPGLNLLIYFK
ncbi:MAG: pentapeptide repeat-containing protein [Elainellaceae cyanobacterium]